MSQRDLSPIVALSQGEMDPEPSSLPRSLDLDLEGGAEIQDDLESLSAVEPAELPIGFDSAASTPDWNDVASPTDVDVNRYADRLMDEIFTEVEHTLDSGVAPLELEEAEVLNIRSLEMPSLALPAALVPRVDAYTPGDGALALPAGSSSEPSSPFVDRLLLGSVLVSCAVTLGWWALDHDRYDVLLSSPATVPTETTPVAAPPETANEQFVAYLQNALQNLEANSGTDAAALATNNPPGDATLPKVPTSMSSTAGELPTVTIPGTPSLGDLNPLPSNVAQNTAQNTGQNVPQNTGQKNTSAPGTVLERVYIPVYPNTPGLVPPQSTVAGSLPGILNPAPPLVASGNLPTVPVGVPAAPVAGPARPASSTPSESPSTGVAPVPEPASVTHSLVGILELGDQSAALFQINGVTRRVHLGEAIGSAGWMLVEVSNQEAIIRRNGEVRSVYIGQNF